MSQRNPMNERYTSEERTGVSRKSAASAKPKTKAASSVVVKSAEKTPQQKKAERKAERKKEQQEQRELDRKYYTPDTPRYKKLRRLWWASLIAAILCTAVSFLGRSYMPDWLAMVVLFAAYAFIIAAFYIDFSKIKKERRAYQDRMIIEEERQKKAERAAARAERQQQHNKRGTGVNQNRHAKPKTGAAAGAGEFAADETSESPVEESKRGLFGRFSKAKEEKARVQAAQQAATDAALAQKEASEKK